MTIYSKCLLYGEGLALALSGNAEYMEIGRCSEGAAEGMAAPRSGSLPASLRLLLWVGGFGLALWLMLGWSQPLNAHNDFTQNAWLPARLVMERANPYNPTRAQVDASLGLYSTAFDGFNSGANFHFIYPVWVALLMSPFGAMSLLFATAMWRAFSLVLLFWSGGSLMRSTNPVFRQAKPSVWVALGLTFFLCFIYKANIQNLIVGQFAVMELALMTVVWAWLLRSSGMDARRLVWGDALAGVALAVLATKPQSTGLALLLIAVWAISRRRFLIPAVAAVSMAVLLLLPLLFYPTSLGDWFSVAFLRGQASSQAYVSASVWGLSYNLLGGKGSPWVLVAAALSLAGVALLLPMWRRDLRDKTSAVPRSLPLTLCMMSLISPYMLAYEHLLLLLPALVALASLGLPASQEDGQSESLGRKLLRLGIYAWLGVLPILTSLLQVAATGSSPNQKDYPIVLQAATMLFISWKVGTLKVHCTLLSNFQLVHGGTGIVRDK